MHTSLLLRATARLCLLASFVGGLEACTPRESTATTWFAAPSGLALAGSNFDKIFVANAGADSVQVITLESALEKIDLVPAPARYFPLSIPAGPHPELVSATADGRFVFVLDTITSTVRLIDADKLQLVRDANHMPLALPLGPRESQPIALVGSKAPCTPTHSTPNAPCVGRAFALLRRPGMVAVLNVIEDGQGPRLAIDQVAAIGGAPTDMAVHDEQSVLFVTDASAPHLTRLTLASPDGSAARQDLFALGLPGGPVALSFDHALLAVGRPSAKDLVFFASPTGDAATGDLQALDANPIWTPTPACLADCGQQDPDLCSGAHPGDMGLCASDGGYANTQTSYGALYVGAVPRAVVALGDPAEGGALVERCVAGPQGNVSAQFSRAFAVATLNGGLFFAGMPDDGTGVPRLVEASTCQTPMLQVLSSSPASPADVLAPCGELPEGRRRMQCLKDSDGRDAGVALMRGHGDALSMGLWWEAVLDGGDRSNGGGAINDAGHFIDTSGGVSLGTLGIVPRAFAHGVGAPGDILEVMTEPRREAGCDKLLPIEGQICRLERRIIGLAGNQQDELVLDTPLPQSCFDHGAIAYRIRAGGAFLAAPIDDSGQFSDSPVRLMPGDSYGPGRLSGAWAPIFFTIDPALDTGANESSCSLYHQGTPASGMPAWRNRKTPLTWRIKEPFTPVQAGQRYDSLGTGQGNIGRVPGAMVMTKPKRPGEPGRLVVSFSGSESILITAPLDSANLVPGQAIERVLR